MAVCQPRFYFGAMSPYAWFAGERIDRRSDHVAWRAVFAGALFKAVGRESWALTDARAAGLADCEARAEQHGLGPIRWPDGWPGSDVLAARTMVAADRQGRLQPFALAAMRAAFRDGARLEDPDTLAAIARSAGLDGGPLLADAGRDSGKVEI